MSGKVLTIGATGKDTERPTSFPTVAAAELASFLPGETCSVLETRRFYQFDAASIETRDGIRVLTPAGGGRLLTTPWVLNATEVEFSTPTTHLQDLQAVVSHNWSASLMDGGGFTDNGNGTYSLAAAEAALRQPTGGQGATIGLYNVAAVSNQSIADGTQTYITVKLTGSTAAYATQQDLSLITGRDEIEAYSITRVGSSYHVVDLRRQNVDHAQLACRMEWDTKGISKVPGTAYSSSASSRYLQVSAGKFHVPIRLSATPAFDTSATSTFTQIHGSTASGWTRTAGQTQINNTNYNDGTGTLATLTANQWGVRWVFMDVDSSDPSLSVLIGPNNGSEADANSALIPSDLPPELRKTAPGVLISKIIIQKNAASITASWISNYDAVTQRQSTPTTVHDSLGGILGNGTYHLSEAERNASTRIATASQSGLMSATQADSVAKSAVAGTSGQVQYNNNGSLGASSSLTYINGVFGIGNGILSNNYTVEINHTTLGGLKLVTQLGAVQFRMTERSTFSNVDFMVTSGGGLAIFPTINNPIYLAESVGVLTNNPSGALDIHGKGTTTGLALQVADSGGNSKLTVLDNGLLTTSGGSVINYDTLTADTTLTQSSKSCAALNPSGTGLVLTMHLSPPDGIKQRTVNVSAYAVTLGRNSQKMAGAEANYTLPAYTAIDWQYYGATIGWLPISISTW